MEMESSKKLEKRRGGAPALLGKLKKYLKGYIGMGDGFTVPSKERLQFAARGLLYGVLSFLFAGAPAAMGTYPLGFALLAASRKYTVFIYAGAATASLFIGGQALPMFSAYTVLIAARYFFSRSVAAGGKVFGESLLIRTGLGTSAAFIIGLYNVISGGFLYYDLIGLLFLLCAVPLLCYLMAGAAEPSGKGTPLYELGVSIILFALVYSLADYSVFGFSLSSVSAFLITLFISKTGGTLRGGALGVFLGIAVNPEYAGAYGLAGLLSGLLWRISGMAATAAACIAGIAFGTYVDGFTALRRFAPDLLGASLLFMPAVQFGLLPQLTLFSKGEPTHDSLSQSAVLAQGRQRSTIDKITSMSTAFCSIADVFYTLSDRLRRPGIYELKQLCDEVFEKNCKGCPANAHCHVAQYTSTADGINKLTKALHKNGHVLRSDVPTELCDRCHNIDKMVSEINLKRAELLENKIKRDKTEIFAMDYEAMAKLLETTVDENSAEYEPDEALGGKIKEASHYLGISAASVTVYGKRRKTVVVGGIDLAKMRAGAESIRTSFENVCKIPLGMPTFGVDGDYVSMSLKSARRFRATGVRASDKKEKEEISGDSIAMFENKEDWFYALISDGMGSGRDAAITSKICGLFLEKMLMGGNNKSVTLEMLNNFIRNKNMECFATVDLFSLDLLSGEAGFIKSGAAPSYILRDGSLFKITSNSMPIGITREINAEEIRFTLENNDIVVMISDGVAQSFEDSIWLANMLTYDWNSEGSLGDMAKKILAGAKENNKRSDDITVGLIKIQNI